MFKAKTPHFSKIILQDTILEGKLGIPKKFVKRYGNYLVDDEVFLKVPSGTKWRVELVKDGDDNEILLLGNVWKQFIDHYSISHGSLLVFGFEDLKNCCFNVIIFDKTSSEIDYPPRNSEETLMLPSSRPLKKMKQETNFTELSEERVESFVKRTQRLSGEEKANALDRANRFYKSKNPSFSIAMQPAHVSDRYRLVIPASSALKYYNKKQGSIILNSIDGKTWSIEYANRKTKGNRASTVVSVGWRKFVEDNDLEVGDVCVFELINHNATKLKVVICRHDQLAKGIPSSIENSKRGIKRKHTSASTSAEKRENVDPIADIVNVSGDDLMKNAATLSGLKILKLFQWLNRRVQYLEGI